MRRFVLLAIAAVALVTVTAAQARHPRTSLSASGLAVVYGHGVMLSGRLSDHAAGTMVSILARPFNRSGLSRLESVTTSAGGRWQATVKPSIATTYEASVEGVPSRTLMVGVRPALTMRVLAGGAIHALAAGGKSFKGSSIQLQRRLSSGGWSTIGKRQLNRHSAALFAASNLPTGKLDLRLALSVNQAGPGFLGSVGQAMLLPARWLTLSLTTFKVDYGNALKLFGRVSGNKPGVEVAILARPFLATQAKRVAMVRTDSSGHWSYRIQPPFTTSYQAQWANASTRLLTVGVRPAMEVRILSGDRIWAHVSLTRNVKGRALEVQQRLHGVWKTVATAKLNGKATTILEASMLPAGTSTLRTAFSVNAAGPGFLGGFSKPFVYHR